MTTTMTLGPLIKPLTLEEKRQCHQFASIARKRGGELWVVEDHVIGYVFAWATLPGPATDRAAATSGATT